jgi:hypothetical protein
MAEHVASLIRRKGQRSRRRERTDLAFTEAVLADLARFAAGALRYHEANQGRSLEEFLEIAEHSTLDWPESK